MTHNKHYIDYKVHIYISIYIYNVIDMRTGTLIRPILVICINI
jgi:hypothetical protein